MGQLRQYGDIIGGTVGTAEEVVYDSTHSVKDKIDEMDADLSELFVVEDIKNSLTPSKCTIGFANAAIVGNLCLLSMVVNITDTIVANEPFISGLPHQQTYFSPIEALNGSGTHIPMHIGSSNGVGIIVMSSYSPVSSLTAGDSLTINGVYYVES